ncbi:MAG: nuclear transport factor 2 family protein [Chloracidobacterium sp.]|nr:nuclear transport factor 2 family protein [Chloracidobacterium sp.]
MMISALSTMTVLSLACCAQNPTTAAQENPTIVAQKIYDEYDQSWANHDLNQMLGFFDPTFIAVDTKGKRIGFEDFRKQQTDIFNNAKLRNFNKKTTIKDVQLQAGRMVIYYQVETHFQYKDQTLGWESLIDTTSAESTWQRTRDRWKLVMIHALRDNIILDPKWEAMKRQEIQALGDKIKAIQGASSVLTPCNFSYNGCR